MKSTKHTIKPYITIIRNAKISELTPLLIPIAECKGLNLSRLSDFKKAVKLLENHILYEIWHTGWGNIDWNYYSDVKAEYNKIKGFNINKKLLANFLRVKSKNIIEL